MSFDEQPDSHCPCCRSWEERISQEIESAATYEMAWFSERQRAESAERYIVLNFQDAKNFYEAMSGWKKRAESAESEILRLTKENWNVKESS